MTAALESPPKYRTKEQGTQQRLVVMLWMLDLQVDLEAERHLVKGGQRQVGVFPHAVVRGFERESSPG